MHTFETVEMMRSRLKDEVCSIGFQVERLNDVALSVHDPELEGHLRDIVSQMRKSIDAMYNELQPEESSVRWLDPARCLLS